MGLKHLSKVPTCAFQTILFCNNDIYPNSYKLFTIQATLIVLTSSSEQIVLNHKGIKFDLRNIIG